MSEDEQAVRDALAGEVERIIRRAAVFSEGLQSPFWQELRDMLMELERGAFARFTDANATDTAVVIELQQIGKLRRVLESKIRAAIDEADAISQ